MKYASNGLAPTELCIRWDTLPAHLRAELLRAGFSFPSETEEEARHRLKRQFDLLDDSDLTALTGASADTLARHRVNGTGPRPVRIMRTVFYQRADVADWIAQHRDGAPQPKRRGMRKVAE